MIDELLSRIAAYEERIDAYWTRREAAEAEDEYDEPADDTDDRPYPPIPDVVEFDKDVEVIRGGMPNYRDPLRPLRYSVSPDNPWYFDIDGVVFSRETGLLIRFPPGRGGEYIIPDDERITGIGDFAFAGNQLLRKIGLNGRIRYIGNKAFMKCLKLQEMIVPAETEFVGERAFGDCAGLKKAVLNCALKSIPHSCFKYDGSLKTVRYPACITEIERYAFSGCGRLTDMKPVGQENTDSDLVISQSVSRIGRETFMDCRLIRSVRLPDRPLDLEGGVFRGCSALERINTESVRSYGSFCFRDCANLADFSFGKETVSLEGNIFWHADNLKHIDFTCSPELVCDADALPAGVDYTVDTRAWLSVQKPWSSRPLFEKCVMNVVDGECVPVELGLKAVNVLKRNRKKCFDWFLSDDALLDWVLDLKILDCEDCVRMIESAEADAPDRVEKIRTYMKNRFNQKKIAASQSKWEEQEQKRIEAEHIARQAEEERVRKREEAKATVAAGGDIPLEEMEFTDGMCHTMKQHGINTLREAAAMTYDQLRRIPGFREDNVRAIMDKIEFYSGIRIPEPDWFSFSMEEEDLFFSADDQSDLNRSDDL